MPKGLCISAMVVAVLLLVVFGLDLAIAFPFQRASTFIDVCFMICTGLLGYLSWTTLREQT